MTPPLPGLIHHRRALFPEEPRTAAPSLRGGTP